MCQRQKLYTHETLLGWMGVNDYLSVKYCVSVFLYETVGKILNMVNSEGKIIKYSILTKVSPRSTHLNKEKSHITQFTNFDYQHMNKSQRKTMASALKSATAYKGLYLQPTKFSSLL